MILAPFALLLLFFRFEKIDAPRTIPKESGSIAVAGSGKAQRWTAEWTMEPALESGRPAVHFTEVGRGQYSGFTGQVSWKTDAFWAADRALQPLRSEKIVRDANGRVIDTERKIFDPAKGTVHFERQWEGQSEARQFSVPSDTLEPEGIAGVLRFLPFEHLRSESIHLFTNEPRLYEMKAELRGRDQVKTASGEYECYKIELVPQLGALNVLHALLPKAYFWFTVAPPHFWVRYEGPENGAGTPHITMELKTYEPK
jgi:Protein of unknown function (DUF3108)